MTYTARATFVGSSPDGVDHLIDTSNQLYQLSRIGYLATESQEIGLVDPKAAFCGLFEVMARLADEIRGQLDEIDDLSPDFRDVVEAAMAGTHGPKHSAQSAPQSASSETPVQDLPDGAQYKSNWSGKPEGPVQ